MEKIFKALEKQLAAGQTSVLVTIIDQAGSTPRGLGTQMLVGAKGILAGTVGGGAIEQRAINHSLELLVTGQAEVCAYDLSGANRSDLGMVCGGGVTLLFNVIAATPAWQGVLDAMLKGFEENAPGFLVQELASGATAVLDEAGNRLAGVPLALSLQDIGYGGKTVEGCFVLPLATRQRVILCGGGHVAQSLVPVLASVDFQVTVVEARPEFARKELFPLAKEVLLVDYTALASYLELKSSDFFVIMTHGHVHDYTLQEQLLRKDYAYIGVMGSKRKIASVNERLTAAGICQEKIASVHTPIGVKIGAVTPAEIAISVAAECIAVRAALRQKTVSICPSSL